MNSFYFILRHTPFWAIPSLLLLSEACLLLHRKGKKKAILTIIPFIFFITLILCAYVWFGGGEKFVLRTQEILVK